MTPPIAGQQTEMASPVVNVGRRDDFAARHLEIPRTDISAHNLDMVTPIIQRFVTVNGSKTLVTTATDRRSAVEGACHRTSVVRIGGLEPFGTEIFIPLKYRVDQGAGDTIFAGAWLTARSGGPVILDLCKFIKEQAVPGALLLTYANQLVKKTRAAIDADRVHQRR